MNQRTLLNLGLLVLLAGLALIAWYRPGQPPPTVAAKLNLFDAKAIARIDVLRAGKDTVSLVKAGDEWRMMAPLQAPADRFLVDTLLGMTKATSYAQFDAGSVQRGDFRLDAPPLTVRFDDVEIAFGDTETLSGHRYVMAGKTIYLVDDAVFHRLTGGAHTFVSRLLLPPDSRIESLALPGHAIARGADGRWVVTPEQPGISSDDVVALVDEWSHAQAIRISLADSVATDRSVTVRLKGETSPWRFGLLRHESEWLLVRPDLGIQYHFTENQYARLTTLTSGPPHGE